MKRIYSLLTVLGVAILSNAQSHISTLSLTNIEATLSLQTDIIRNDTVIALDYPTTITGLSVSGTAVLEHSSNSLVRITLQDDYNTETLVYELFPLLADSSVVSFDNVALETAVLDNITAKQLNIKIINASLQLTGISTSIQSVMNYSTRQSQTLEAQSSYIIDKLNENLEKRNIPWRAGETSLSQLTYEEKKAIFGGEVPNLGGFEYYKGGIFVMPGYEPKAKAVGIATASATASTTSTATSPYVKEWDWRNRHGKNWMTSVKNQGNCSSCWAFASVGLLESYSNLYYNQLLNLDLSEQELVSCAPALQDYYDGCDPNDAANALSYIKSYGVMPESEFAYQATPINCSQKPSNPSERIKFESFNEITGMEYGSDDEMKDSLLNAPYIMSSRSYQHYMLLVGYKELELGDTVYANLGGETIIIGQNNYFGDGTTAWLFKNSYGESFGEDGYSYVVGDPYSFYAFYKITGKITSLNYTDDDIIVEDADNDGYYFWGIGERPSSLPAWVPALPDGDDSNPDYGPIDQYGHLQEITLETPLEITTDKCWTENNYLYSNIIISNGGSLTIKSDIILYKDATIIVESGGNLTVDSGSISQANIRIKAGANMSIQNNGKVMLSTADDFVTETGATLNITKGGIEIEQ